MTSFSPTKKPVFFGAVLAKIWASRTSMTCTPPAAQQLEKFKFTRGLPDIAVRRMRFCSENSRTVIGHLSGPAGKSPAKSGYGRQSGSSSTIFSTFRARNSRPRRSLPGRKGVGPSRRKRSSLCRNFGAYQGIPLLLEAARNVREKAIFLLVSEAAERRSER